MSEGGGFLLQTLGLEDRDSRGRWRVVSREKETRRLRKEQRREPGDRPGVVKTGRVLRRRRGGAGSLWGAVCTGCLVGGCAAGEEGPGYRSEADQ